MTGLSVSARGRTGAGGKRKRRAVGVLAAALVAGCASTDPCVEHEDVDCPDLRYSGVFYHEWREFDPAPVLQEVGDGVFPACNDAESCDGPDLGGYQATDVWKLEDVDPGVAILGFRQHTRTWVIFVRKGVDPARVPELARAVRG